METNAIDCKTKIKQLLDKLLQPTFRIQNDVYLNRLLTHLTNKKDNVAFENTLLNSTIFTNWLMEAITYWDNNNNCTTSHSPPINIASFTLNLVALLSKDEQKFTLLNNNNFYIKLIRTFKCREPDTAASIKLAYIKLLGALLEHKSGIEWIIINRFCTEDVLKLTLTIINQTIYVTREGRQFITKLLERTVDIDEMFCCDIIKVIMLPLSDFKEAITNNNDDINNMLELREEIVYKNLSPTLQLIGFILEEYLQSEMFAQKNFHIVTIFFKQFNLEQTITNYLLIAQNPLLIFDLGKIMFIVHFLHLYHNVISNSCNIELDVQKTICNISEIFNSNILKGNYENVLKFSYFGQFYWSLMSQKISGDFKDANPSYSMSYQLLIMQMLPIFSVCFKYCSNVAKIEENDMFRSNFIDTMFKSLSLKTIRIGYTWRDYLTNQSNLFEIVVKDLLYVMKSRKYYHRSKATTMFQCLLYCLKDIVSIIKLNPEKFTIFEKEINFMTLLMDTTGVLIEEFQITWRDSVETICVMSVAFDFLSLATWPTKLVVKSLKLINISIANFMSPNMALLVDRTNDSTMVLIGPLLYAKLHDSSWEVRDSALEVVCTMSAVSNTKFPSLQQVLLDSDLPNLMIKMATGDGEGFVRATAIKCLQEMTKIEDFWENILKDQDLPQTISRILQNETEGIVRSEAATIMCILYETHRFALDVTDQMYDVMVRCMTNDLHWEVKVKALNFWDKVITTHLNNQGMIDGAFPNVTFSKENRKIVNLTDSEIRKRLHKVLVRLSEIGCLSILVMAIQDECDLEVSRTAVKITTKFIDLFRKYDFDANDSTPSSSPSMSSGIYSMPSPAFSTTTTLAADDEIVDGLLLPSSEDNHRCEDILNNIVSSNDITLLGKVYNNSSSTDDCADFIQNYNNNYTAMMMMRKPKNVAPIDFLNFARQDLDAIINEKSSWLSDIDDLGSLLDDMLRNYHDDDINNMDCY